MIVEMQTLQLKPKSPPMVERKFEQALPERTKLSPLGAFFHSEVGALNQIILLWPYASLAEREAVKEQAARLANWPPDYREFCISEESMVLRPAPFSPPLEPRAMGNVYEIRTYTYQPGTIPIVIDRWTPMMPERLKLSALAGCWYSEFGPLHRWVHMWPYADAAERQRVRADAVARRLWPPDTAEYMLKMENMLAVPARFSPLR